MHSWAANSMHPQCTGEAANHRPGLSWPGGIVECVPRVSWDAIHGLLLLDRAPVSPDDGACSRCQAKWKNHADPRLLFPMVGCATKEHSTEFHTRTTKRATRVCVVLIFRVRVLAIVVGNGDTCRPQSRPRLAMMMMIDNDDENNSYLEWSGFVGTWWSARGPPVSFLCDEATSWFASTSFTG